VSIDDNEVENLKKMMNEIFGENNFVTNIIVNSNPRGSQASSEVAVNHEYLVIFKKNKIIKSITGFELNNSEKSEYNKRDEIGIYREIGLRKRGADSRKEDSPTLFYSIFYNHNSNSIELEKTKNSIEIIPKLSDGSLGRWRWSRSKVLSSSNKLLVRQVKRNNSLEYDVFQKDYLTEEKTRKPMSIWQEKEMNVEKGTEELKSIFSVKIFDYPKPLEYLKKIVSMYYKNDSIVLDFFSGSATTAHAVMQLNAEDGGNRKFIMVQLPEITQEDSEAYKAGYKNICEIGKERIRRAGELVKKDLIEKNAKLGKDEEKGDPSKLDIGFKVFKLDESNFKEWDSSKEPTIEQLELFADPIKEGKSEEEVLYEVLLKYGVFDQEVKKLKINNKDIYSISDNYLVIMLSNKIEDKDIEEIKKLKPKVVIFRDSGFNGNDTVKINAFYNLTKSGVEEVKTV
jgi:adenine-specific DNA-methyltransferase